MNQSILVLLSAASLSIMGCSTNIYSPPSRVNLLESSATLKKGENSGALAGGATGTVFGFGTTHLSGTYRRGLDDDLEVGIDANVVSVNNAHAAAELDNEIYGGRLQSKWNPEMFNGDAAITAGLGGGYNAEGGGFVSPDLGVIIAVENRHLVPYLATSVFLSQPIAAEEIDVSTANREYGDDEPIGTRSDISKLTWGYYVNMGLKMPIHTQRLPSSQARPVLNLYSGVSFLDIRNEDGRAVGLGVMFGPEMVF